MSSGDPLKASVVSMASVSPETGLPAAPPCIAPAQKPSPFDLAHSRETTEPIDLGRRVLLGTVLAASATALLPPAFAAPADDAAQAAFVAVSKLLTGRDTLDPMQASRLYQALIDDDPQFATGLQALVTLIDQRKIDPLQLQQVLDTENSPVAALPRKIATAWYIGVVGDGEKARCITFETNLTNVVVSDKLNPPSYCYGGYGSWAEKPV